MGLTGYDRLGLVYPTPQLPSPPLFEQCATCACRDAVPFPAALLPAQADLQTVLKRSSPHLLLLLLLSLLFLLPPPLPSLPSPQSVRCGVAQAGGTPGAPPAVSTATAGRAACRCRPHVAGRAAWAAPACVAVLCPACLRCTRRRARSSRDRS